MIKLISIIGLVLTVGVAAFTFWSKSHAITILDNNHPGPRGEMSRTDYMKQVCHVSTADFLISKLDKNGFEVDNYCNCFAINSVQLLSPSDDYGYVLGYHTNNVIAQRSQAAGIDAQTGAQLPFESVKPLRKAYEKTYGVSKKRQLVFSKKSMDITNTCISELISR